MDTICFMQGGHDKLEESEGGASNVEEDYQAGVHSFNYDFNYAFNDSTCTCF